MMTLSTAPCHSQPTNQREGRLFTNTHRVRAARRAVPHHPPGVEHLVHRPVHFHPPPHAQRRLRQPPPPPIAPLGLLPLCLLLPRLGARKGGRRLPRPRGGKLRLRVRSRPTRISVTTYDTSQEGSLGC
eukprot:382773-Prorocentrum_minimum.AAC.1